MPAEALAGLFGGLTRGLEPLIRHRMRQAERREVTAERRDLMAGERLARDQAWFRRLGLAREERQERRAGAMELRGAMAEAAEVAHNRRLALVEREHELRQQRTAPDIKASLAAIGLGPAIEQAPEVQMFEEQAEGLEALALEQEKTEQELPEELRSPMFGYVGGAQETRQRAEKVRADILGIKRGLRERAGVPLSIEQTVRAGKMTPVQAQQTMAKVFGERQEKVKEVQDIQGALTELAQREDMPTWILRSVAQGKLTLPQAMKEYQSIQEKEKPKAPKTVPLSRERQFTSVLHRQLKTSPLNPRETSYEAFIEWAKTQPISLKAYGIAPQQVEPLLRRFYEEWRE